ncbi:MAG: hypothetical protein KH135_03395 [Firmicutes bacterium]|nr:hypothetical protein [Bacillota bacterium]
MNIELVLKILMIGIGAGYISTKTINRIKTGFQLKNKILVNILSIILSFAIGILFSFSFSDLNLIYSLWAGLFTVIGAESLYKNFTDRFTREVE